MNPTEFMEQLRLLTGRPVHPSPLPDSDMNSLTTALGDDSKIIDYSQFNELLLLANKDRVKAPFFQRFFCSPAEDVCTVGDIAEGVRKFQKMAMLRFGNFVYAYRTLSKIRTKSELDDCLREKQSVEVIEAAFERRRDRIVNIKDIPREDTYFIGYLSANQVRADHKLATGLLQLLNTGHYASFEELQNDMVEMGDDVEEKGASRVVVEQSTRLINKFKKGMVGTFSDFQKRITSDATKLSLMHNRLEKTLEDGIQNSDIYLSWDHMDVYFATSMRKPWEFEDLYDFVHSLMDVAKVSAKGKTLTELNVRYFDPTQSFDQNRVNKGLVEALMLKRAGCTVYSVQDTDTLGKDSELAATLAQGKPVIAYAPEVDIASRSRQLRKRSPMDLKERLQWIIYEGVAIDNPSFIQSFARKLDEFEQNSFWRSLTDAQALKQFQVNNEKDLEHFSASIATAEKQIYDRRFRTLQKSHPLAIQVNLDTGVANGVLVVRNIQTCAELLWRILTNALEFNLNYDNDTKCWYLTELLTDSVYRVVTDNEKLTNCFWNFYQGNRD